MNTTVALVANLALFVVAGGAALVWLRAPREDKIPFAATGVLATVLVAIAVKAAGALWTDPRPFVLDHTTPLIKHAADNGFPSDHATLAAAVAIVVLLRQRTAGAALALVALLLGWSRVAAHVHHWPDVLVGFTLGGAIAVMAHVAIRALWARVQGHRPAADPAVVSFV